MQNFFNFLLDTSATTETDTGTYTLSSILSLVVPLVLVVVVFYFFLLRPQKKQDKQIASMRDSLGLGDIIITTGGIVGRIIRIKDEMLLIETGGNKTRIQLERKAVREIKAKANQPEGKADE